jgi:hypothetical protein
MTASAQLSFQRTTATQLLAATAAAVTVLVFFHMHGVPPSIKKE